MDVRGLQSAKLWDRFRVRVIVGGVCNSENMVLSDLGIDIGTQSLSELLASPQAKPFHADAFAAHIRAVGCAQEPQQASWNA
jgi:hypothetical protein